MTEHKGRIGFDLGDPATPELIEALLADIKDFTNQRVHDTAKEFALRDIEEEIEIFGEPPDMGELQHNTILFIDGYEQALEDLSKLAGTPE